MTLLEQRHVDALHSNRMLRDTAQIEGMPEPDPLPVVKFFNPMGAATWLATELDEDGVAGESRASPQLFGLADLGFGCPELGSFSLHEIASLAESHVPLGNLPYGLSIECDLGFKGLAPLSAWADAARIAGSLIGAEQILREIASGRPDPSREASDSREIPPGNGG